MVNKNLLIKVANVIWLIYIIDRSRSFSEIRHNL